MAETSLLLFLLFTYGTGTFAQFVLTQPPSSSASPGETVKIPCTRSSGGIKDHYVSWYQHKPGTAPKLLIYQFSNRYSGISDRFSGSTDTSANSATLTISGVQAEDENDYYCLSYTSSNQWIFGTGTTLIITGGAESPPIVNLFPPSKEEITSKSKATLVCLVQDFNPGIAQVTWEADGAAVSNGVETTKPTKHNNKYMVSSYLTVTPSDWERHERYTCKVTHKGSNYEKSVSHSQCP